MSQSEKQEVLALIGARSGSKDVPHKNIRKLGGVPLLGWIIGAARSSRLINRVIVSTDSEDYAKIARDHGAETPFVRPQEISGDASPDLDYLLHAVDWLEENENYRSDIVVRLIPTVPFQRPEDIDACVSRLLGNASLDSVMGVVEARQHPDKALKITPEGLLATHTGKFSLNTYPNARQVHEKAYFRGNIIAVRYPILKKTRLLYGERSGYYIIPKDHYPIDIDSETDFLFAEALVNKKLVSSRISFHGQTAKT